jgi:hypothetical protein
MVASFINSSDGGESRFSRGSAPDSFPLRKIASRMFAAALAFAFDFPNRLPECCALTHP